MAQTPNDGALVIQPMGIGEVLDTGFNLARRHLRYLMTLAAWGILPMVVLHAVAALALGGLDEIDLTDDVSVLSGLGVLLTVAGELLAVFALQIAVVRLIEHGSPQALPGVGALYGAGARRLLTFLLFMIVMCIPLILVTIIFPLGVYLMVRWSMFFVPYVAERQGAIASLKRSWALTSKCWWHTAAILLLMSITVGLLQAALGSLISGIALVLPGEPEGVIESLLASLGSGIASIVFTPISTAIASVLYFELRARAEGFDLQQRAQLLHPPSA